jgi:transcriptional regulator with XRE-family HTH domain
MLTVTESAAMAGLGDMLRSNRLARKWSLRQLADQIGVTPAYVADLEAERRLPGNELKETHNSSK